VPATHHAWAAMPPTVPTTATWRHEHPATCQRGYQGNHHGCTHYLLQLHTTLQKAKTGALPDARQGSAASVITRPAGLCELFHFFTVA